MECLYGRGLYRLSTGREIDGHLSIRPDDAALYEGYDSEMLDAMEDNDWNEPPTKKFTPAERREVGEYMMALWRQWIDLPAESEESEENN